MAHTLFTRRIKDTHRNRHQLDAMPRGKNHQLQLCLITRCQQGKSPQLVQWIEAIPSLGIFKISARLHPEPKVGETISKVASLASLHALHHSGANNQATRALEVYFQKKQDVLWIMLSIGIKGDCIGKPHVQRLFEPHFQSVSLALVVRISHQGDARDMPQDFHGAIRTTIGNNNDIIAIAQRVFHHLLDGGMIIVGRNNHADTPISQ